MDKQTYTNRYGDVFTFTPTEDGNILWEGNFKHCRIGYPNVYKPAYEKYRKDGGNMFIEDFINEVHKYDNETFERSEISKAYGELVYSDMDNINMVDASGGPYIDTHTDLGKLLGIEEFKGLCVSKFTKVDTGYLIHTYNKFAHLEDWNIIGGII